MSQKTTKRDRRNLRKVFKCNYLEFLSLTRVLNFYERFRIAWSVVWKLKSEENRLNPHGKLKYTKHDETGDKAEIRKQITGKGK